jgi:ABC-type nitrate/sulfonate/bicarbonate transport system substrate-binding protein
VASGSDAKLHRRAADRITLGLAYAQRHQAAGRAEGKSLAVTRPGDLTFRLARALLKKFNLTEGDVKILTVGGTGQVEPFNALRSGFVEAALVTPPLDVRGRRDGFSLIYRLNDLGLPAVYSSLHTNAKTLRKRPLLAQKWVAALAESLQFVEKNPDQGKAAVGKALKLNDADALQSAYDAYAKLLVNRRLTVPETSVAGVIEVARDQGTNVRRKASEMIDNRFAEDLEKSGFLKGAMGRRDRTLKETL